MMEEVAQPQEVTAVEDIEDKDTGMFACIFILHHLMSVISVGSTESVGSQTIDVMTKYWLQTAGVVTENVAPRLKI